MLRRIEKVEKKIASLGNRNSAHGELVLFYESSEFRSINGIKIFFQVVNLLLIVWDEYEIKTTDES